MPELTVELRAPTKRSREQDPVLSVVLVCWNNKAYLDPCLKSLYESGMKNTYEVVVVDNGSTDGTQQLLAEKYPEVALIQNAGNVGLGRASNQGIEATRGHYVLLLNNDTIVNGASLDTMIEFQTAASIGGRFFEKHQVQTRSVAEFSAFQRVLDWRADHSAAMRRRNAFGFSANRRPASRAADFKCALRRASITGDNRDRHGANGWWGAVKFVSNARSWQEPSWLRRRCASSAHTLPRRGQSGSTRSIWWRCSTARASS